MAVDPTKRARLKRIRDRIELKIQRTEYCWFWLGNKSHDGRGKVTIDQKKRYVYRVLYELDFGAIPDKWHLHHRCNQPECINPLHLLLVTSSEHCTLHNLGGR